MSATAPAFAPATAAASCPAWHDTLASLAKRSIRRDTDLDQAAWHMSLAVTNLGLLRRLAQLRHDHSGRWARDDPGVLLLCVLASAVLGAASTVALSAVPLGPISLLAALAWGTMAGVGAFVTCAVVGSCALWLLAERLLRNPTPPHRTAQDAEWAYALDVHCNASVPVLVAAAGGLLLLPLLAAGWFGAALSNAALTVAAASYLAVAADGLRTLPFVDRAAGAVASSSAVVAVSMVVATLVGVNVPLDMLRLAVS